MAARPAIRVARVLLLTAAVVGAAWFALSLNYDDEQPRVQTNEGLDAVQDAMVFMQETYREKRRLPSADELAAVSFRHEPHVRAVRLDGDGRFLVVYQGRREIDGKELRLTPYLDRSGEVRWHCELRDMDRRWWPDYCRHNQAP